MQIIYGTPRKRTVEMMWKEPIAHACSWLPPFSPISKKDRKHYVSIKPIRLIIDNNEAWSQRQEQVRENIAALAIKSFKVLPEIQARIENERKGIKAAVERIAFLEAELANSIKKPYIVTFFDRIRWALHLRLLQWKVII
jgi:hypothetical protein